MRQTPVVEGERNRPIPDHPACHSDCTDCVLNQCNLHEWIYSHKWISREDAAGALLAMVLTTLFIIHISCAFLGSFAMGSSPTGENFLEFGGCYPLANGER